MFQPQRATYDKILGCVCAQAHEREKIRKKRGDKKISKPLRRFNFLSCSGMWLGPSITMAKSLQIYPTASKERLGIATKSGRETAQATQ